MATICIDDSELCRPNLLQVVNGKLRARPAVAVFRVKRPTISLPSELIAGYNGVNENPIDFSVIQEDSTPGMFTLELDGTVTVACTGVYGLKVRYGSGGSDGTIIGGRVRWQYPVGENILGFDLQDFTETVNFGTGSDGPEFEASCPGVTLVAGTSIAPQGVIFTGAAGDTVEVSGNMEVVYLGEAL